MSTSPSWFDQEKFSRLVKKVGPKNQPEPAPAPAQQPPTHPSAAETGSDAAGQGLASTARISLVSRPPSLLSEHRALPALPRRTAPLPGLKALFSEPGSSTPTPEGVPAIQHPPAGETPAEEPAPAAPIRVENLVKPDEPEIESEEAPLPENKFEIPASRDEEHEDENITAIWHKMALLNEELAQTIRERDQAVTDVAILREQLEIADAVPADANSEATKEEFARLIRERDAALAEANEAKEQLKKAPAAAPFAPPSFGKPPEDISKTKEVSLLASERDQARKEYADLRKQFETLKSASPRETSSLPNADSAKARKELEQQLDGFRMKLEEKNKEIALLKASAGTGGPGGNDKVMEEITSLREQLTKSKEEASVAQRGLALSQKALHETRDTLREATEGTSLSRHNFDNLKSECAALSQQNTVLQAQNDQLSRELAAAKSKLTTRV